MNYLNFAGLLLPILSQSKSATTNLFRSLQKLTPLFSSGEKVGIPEFLASANKAPRFSCVQPQELQGDIHEPGASDETLHAQAIGV